MSTRRKRSIKYVLFTLVPAAIIGLVLLPAVLSSSGDAVPEQPKQSNLATARTCAECHDDTTLITGRATEWAESVHGTGEAYLRGTRNSCAGCHSGGAFSMMVDAGLNPSQVAEGDPHPTRQDCRACHQIHETYTYEDWALETTAPVALFANEGATYDGGSGNLCTSCHQGRRIFPEPSEGMVNVTSTHWGPHHGPQSDMLLGLSGAGPAGSSAGHYQSVDNTCVACHMGSEGQGIHTYEADIGNCQVCHPGETNFDINGRQSSTQAQLDIIGAELVALGALTSNDVDGHPNPGMYPTNVATALWNWLYIAHEDKSLGVHNPAYTQALLDESCAQLSLSC